MERIVPPVLNTMFLTQGELRSVAGPHPLPPRPPSHSPHQPSLSLVFTVFILGILIRPT